MPAFPIIDTHVHLWDPHRLSYLWLKGIPQLNRPYLSPDYARAAPGTTVEALVFLECDAAAGQSVEEMELVADEAQRDARIRACVPKVPLEQGSAVAPLIETLTARFPQVRGVRRIVEREPDELILSDAFVQGVQLLREFGLHFEITANYAQMDTVLELVRRTAGVPMILDHCGKPDIRGGRIDLFRRHMVELARYPHVMCKLSGLATEAGVCWRGATVRPFIDGAIEAFGVDRILYGSDWPVCLLATSLQIWLEDLDGALAGLAEEDLRKIYRGNANRFYRLGLNS